MTNRALRIVGLAGALAAAGAADALPADVSLAGSAPIAADPVQAFCGPDRCFPRPFWRYRSGAGFRPFRGPGSGMAPPPRFAPFGFRRFENGGGRFGGFRRF